MRYYELEEGVTFNNKQKNEALSRQDINVGIEYEFQAYYNGELIGHPQIRDFIDDSVLKVDKVKNVIGEGYGQVEIITEIMTISEALAHIKNMLAYFNDSNNGLSLRTINQSGMHISISYSDYKLENMNFLKFALLMSSSHFSKIFPEREYVRNFDEVINYSIEFAYLIMDRMELNDVSTFEKQIPYIEKSFESKAMEQSNDMKYHGIKLSDYTTFNGRIELRFFGGNGYEYQLDNIKQELARAIHILGISYTNEYHKEYVKALYKRVHQQQDTSESINYSERISGTKQWSMLSIEDKLRLKKDEKLMAKGMAPAIEPDVYLSAMKRFFPKKIETIIKENNWLMNRNIMAVMSYLVKAKMLDYTYLFINDKNYVNIIEELKIEGLSLKRIKEIVGNEKFKEYQETQ